MKQDLVLSNLHLRDLNPRICGREACAPGHTFGPAVREYHLLHYVVRGTGVFRRAQAVCKEKGLPLYLPDLSLCGDNAAMGKSLRRLAALPPALPVYPGHGPATSIGRECRVNPFLQVLDLA